MTESQTCIVMHYMGPTEDLASEDWQAYAVGPFPSEETAQAFHALIDCECNKILMACAIPPFMTIAVEVPPEDLVRSWVEDHAAHVRNRTALN